MKYKIIVQEEKEYPEKAPHATQTYMDTILEMSSDDPDVVAATLRSLANKLSPPINHITR